jgi:hypothetical protein
MRKSLEENTSLTGPEMDKVVSEGCTEVGFDKFVERSPELKSKGMEAWVDIDSEPIVGKTRLTGPGVSQEINLPRLVEVVKEGVWDLPIRPIAQVAAVGVTAAVVGGSALYTTPLELKNISPEGLEVDEYGSPTAPYVSPTDPHNFIDKK